MTQLGKYTLHEQLGKGGFGTVYRATDNIGRVVAVKILKPGWSDDPDVVERFRREAMAAGSLFHSHIATILDTGDENGRLYIVMRYIDGLSLEALLARQGRLSFEQASEILVNIAEALDYAHRSGFLHRDVKPANIIVSEKAGAVLTDFGLVSATLSSGMSTTKVLLGTTNYIAPEIWNGQQASAASDIYSLACVFYEMLTGKKMFTGDSPVVVMTRHVTAQRDLPAEWPQGVPSGIQAVFEAALSIDPAQRQVTALQLAGEARAAAQTTLASTATQVFTPDEEPTPPSGGTPYFAPGRMTEAGTNGAAAPAAAHAPVALDSPVHGQTGAPPLLVEPAVPLKNKFKGGRLMLVLIGVGLILMTSIWFLRQPGVSQSATETARIIERDETQTYQAVAYLDQTATSVYVGTSTAKSLIETETSSFSAKQTVQAIPTSTTTPSPTSTPTLGIGSTIISEKDGMVMKYIPAGEFLMGASLSDPNALPRERPQHRVILDFYWIDSTEVTNAMFRLFVDATQYTTTIEKLGKGWVWSGADTKKEVIGVSWLFPFSTNISIAGQDDYPVVQVSWEDATQYCKWANRRLPTEAEWEKAARGIDGKKYPWGEQDLNQDFANFADQSINSISWADRNLNDGYRFSAPVGSFPLGASPYGVLDMAGNVWEWTADLFDENYYSVSPLENPTGPINGSGPVIRGGSWNDRKFNLRVTIHGPIVEPALSNLGFRCVLSSTQ